MVLAPGIVFVTAFVVALNALLRNKYVAYVVAAGTGAGLFYSYSVGQKHWLSNPLLYQLWQLSGPRERANTAYKLYWLAVAAACLALAHVLSERRSGH